MRFVPKRKCRVLSEETYGSPVPCSRCKTPFVGSIGVWLARETLEDMPETIAGDETGLDHARVVHPLVIPFETARQVEENLRGHGYHLSPIYSHRSATANRVRDILDDINALKKISG
jgi:hypothetical protein